MNDTEKMYEDIARAEELFQKLSTITSMNEIGDTIDAMDENMAKLVLRKFAYSRS